MSRAIQELKLKSDKLRNLDFQAESPQTMPHNNDNDFLYYWDDFNIFYSLGFRLNARPHKRQRFKYYRVEIKVVVLYCIVLENTKISVNHVECIDSKKRDQIYLTFSGKSDSFDAWQKFAGARTHWVNFLSILQRIFVISSVLQLRTAVFILPKFCQGLPHFKSAADLHRRRTNFCTPLANSKFGGYKNCRDFGRAKQIFST